MTPRIRKISLLGCLAAVAGPATLLFAGSEAALSADALQYSVYTGAPTVRPGREYTAMPIGGWLVYPELFVGTFYDSNVNQTQSDRISSWGARVIPSVRATLNNGIYQTSIYGLVDVRQYSKSGDYNSTQVDAKAGFVQTYEARRDLMFRASADFTRELDVFGGTAFSSDQNLSNMTATSPGMTPPTTVSPQVNPDRYNQYSGSLAGTKILNRAFVSVGGNVMYTAFDNNSVNGNRNGAVYVLATRGGFYLTPQLYAFVDPSLIWQRYDVGSRNSDGYRVTAGIGTAAIGIWSGEVFGGYQAQNNAIIGTYDSAVYGGRLIYSPTRFWTIRASLDETLGATNISGLTGTGSKVTTALVNVGYFGLPRGWSTNGRFGYVRTVIVGGDRVDDGWLAGANVSWLMWRNLGWTLDYQFTSVDSNAENASFDKHLVSLGLSYRY